MFCEFLDHVELVNLKFNSFALDYQILLGKGELEVVGAA